MLKETNEHLGELVTERTAELAAEIAIRKRTEEIIKLNRIYAMLSNINQTIVRVHDIKQLMKDACLIAVDEGKFQSAWIGIVNNKTKKIETSATAGLTNDYFNNAVNNLADKNPVTNVIRSGKHFISNNINTDKSLTGIWEQHSLSLGFNSFVVFPLTVLGNVIGAFCIYSNEVNFFDETEVSLLVEMGNDISFALEYIQKEAERKRKEEALTKTKEQSEGMNRFKSYFLSTMSHELRTPLVSILGFGELLQQDLNDPTHLEFVNNIIEGGKRLNNTLSGILEISRLETANSFVKLQPYNLAEEIKARVKSLLPMAQSKRLFLKTELNDRYLNVSIDTELFGKAFYHLISNGIKFTKEGGVFVTLNHEIIQDNDWAVTKVIDTGVGIPRKNLDKIFGAFNQLSEGYGRSYEGTGLGLTIAKKTVELMKGKIEVESEEGKGSVFSIWLPVILDESQTKVKVEERNWV